MRKNGFTITEVMTALVLGGVLMAMAARGLGPARDLLTVQSARDIFLSYHARTRATAIEKGTMARLTVDVVNETLMITQNGDTIDFVDLDATMGVDLIGGTGGVLCMSPRGYGDPDCNTFTGSATLTFRLGTHSKALTMLPLGQVLF